jgi:alkylated DNA nucleotide flippase Atl1
MHERFLTGPPGTPSAQNLLPLGRYRLGIGSRSDRILRAARVIPKGRWTAYGEIGMAATGTARAARAVARSAARDPAFPAAWRVIHADGSIPEGWGADDGGPERCRRLLEAEGVRFVNGRADPAQKLLWEEIELLLAGEPADAQEARWRE